MERCWMNSTKLATTWKHSLTRVFEHYLARQLFRRGKLDLAQETHQGMDTGIDQGDFAS